MERRRHCRAGGRSSLGAVGGLAGFGPDSLIEIGASTVVIWELPGTGGQRQRQGLRLIGYAFAALAAYLLAQSSVGPRPRLSPAALSAGHHLDVGDRGRDVRAVRQALFCDRGGFLEVGDDISFREAAATEVDLQERHR